MASMQLLYDTCRRWFTIGSLAVFPVILIINAPFGRFAENASINIVRLDGIKSWMVMEIVAPLCFAYAYYTSPFGSMSGFTVQQHVLAGLFLIHYLNRAILSPLRTPSRSKTDIIVPLAGITFNLLNGSLMGVYLSSHTARNFLSNACSTPTFYVGVFLWAIGFAGNIVHDEILLNIRRKAKNKGKASSHSPKPGEHYAIPYGLLYEYVSFPNYFCEWVEWFGFALAASPFPTVTLATFSFQSLSMIFSSASQFAPTLTPPWIFLINEFVLMFPRAYKGHLWYKQRFAEAFPKERKIVVPFLL
ncbi:3-oxo-5-alpha-steroid 4-dehydrogenase-domain-containing protein [Armillaria fumosa]|nr:3-oxo-5-alpha-steroid 4-dehydrogenase-domain-containing protein [Armillaria fumosa]